MTHVHNLNRGIREILLTHILTPELTGEVRGVLLRKVAERPLVNSKDSTEIQRWDNLLTGLQTVHLTNLGFLE